ncbi:DUF3592 domain-containing protein [Thalassoglobus polymorphus]|uniref:DUF3592 domain-containing protein n=1 Tax=Thalassoglobus polymorphus TaxID=2527994 RepID=A0A517QIC2_9PLAN|nr:DUF3592 domain-containing protein [Thalassoglobus polymorphus]QDT31345.1 hypothetical protein Mal48_05780 [Thalassoglobus polymorphus]
MHDDPGAELAPLNYWAITILGWTCAVAAPFLLVMTSWWHYRATASESWPSVPGFLTSVEVTKSNTFVKRQGLKKVQTVSVRYSYEVDGKLFEAEKINVNRAEYRTAAGKGYGFKRTNDVRNPMAVTVYYNPSNPADAALTPGKTSKETFFFYITLIVLILAPVSLYILRDEYKWAVKTHPPEKKPKSKRTSRQ